MPLNSLIGQADLTFARDCAPKELLELNFFEANGLLAPVAGKLKKHCVDFFDAKLESTYCHFQRLANVQLQPVLLNCIRFQRKRNLTKGVHAHIVTLAVIRSRCRIGSLRFSRSNVLQETEWLDHSQ